MGENWPGAWGSSSSGERGKKALNVEEAAQMEAGWAAARQARAAQAGKDHIDQGCRALGSAAGKRHAPKLCDPSLAPDGVTARGRSSLRPAYLASL